MKTDILAVIRQELVQQTDEKTMKNFQSFYKEKVMAYGVKAAIVSRIARKYYPEVKPSGKKVIFTLCEELFKSDYNEEAFIACEWAYRLKDEYEESEFRIFEGWLSKYINNWAKCDTLCNHTIAAFIEKYPRYLENLKSWTKSENRWLRRAAAVTLIIPARQGKFLNDIFEIADKLMEDKDDLVQKGYGWMLKEASKAHQREVLDYVLSNSQLMPGTALRYAIEKMPEDLRRQAMGRTGR